MKVYLLLVNNEEFFFYSDDSEADECREQEPAHRSGLRGWLRKPWHWLQRVFHESNAGAARSAHRCWDWLHSMTRPDESMLVRLRSTGHVNLEHPASHAEADVVRIWFAYLARRGRAHAFYLSYNTIIAPLGPGDFVAIAGAQSDRLLVRLSGGSPLVDLAGNPGGWKRANRYPLSCECQARPAWNRDPDGKACHAAVDGNGDRLDDYLDLPRASSGDRNETISPSAARSTGGDEK